MEIIVFTLLIILLLYYFYSEKFTNDKYNKVIILYHVDWCGYCKKFIPTWNKLKDDKKLNDVLFIDVNMTNDKKNIINNKNINLDDILLNKINNIEIDGYPTINILLNNNLVKYEGKREYNDIIEFIKNN